MEKLSIPFSPFPVPLLLIVSAHLKGVGESISRAFPYIKIELNQAEIPISANEYGAIMGFLSFFYFVFVTASVYFIGSVFFPENALIAAPTIGGLFAIMILAQLSVFPKIKVKRKVRDIERNLIFGLRTLLVEIKSGVTLFDAINVVADGHYGAVSTEFSRAIESINTGTTEEVALEEIASRNPSLFFRRAMWQLLNGIKTGGDISVAITAMVDSLAKEQRNQVRKYGSSLRMLSLVYMMLGVIIPALGLTFLVILGSFPQLDISELMFWGLLIFLVLGQFMFLGMLKAGRPNLVGD
ncbi:MAG: type II secretion system F family protein [Candidatus Diapherotrites archaeon]|nr:type II secretion system F family protein [Candidatus Micrarchaeota archaeon]MBU1939671.1 type II secretion system F family protein [Candidatus Micrarchaeota archaeon]